MLHRVSDLVRYASDASPYRYLPQVVVLARTVDDVRAILAYCTRTGRHATFRAGGTSMNGQSQSDGLVAQGAEAVELMLAPALAAAAQAFPRTPQYWRSLDPAAAASARGGPLLAVVSET